MSLLVKLDRLIIGLILRSKLVFLISVQPHAAFIEGARLGFSIRGKCADYILPSVWTGCSVDALALRGDEGRATLR